MAASTREIEFANITGKSFINMPYTVHNRIPVARTIYINNEISFVSFTLMVLITWGRKETVVHVPASSPITAIAFVSIIIAGVNKSVNINYTHYNTLNQSMQALTSWYCKYIFHKEIYEKH